MKNFLKILSLKILLSSSFVILFHACAFGSTGNSLEENAIMLETLLKYLREAKSVIASEIYFYDDQGNRSLGEFSIQSNGNKYSIELKSESYLKVSQMEYWISQTKSAFSQLGHIYLHTGEVVDTSSSGNPNYNIPYITASGKTIQNFIEKNNEDETGYLHKEELSLVENVPQGKLAKSVLKGETLVIFGSIRNTSNQQKEFQLQLNNFEITLIPECNLTINAFQTLKLYLRFKYSNLFKDTSQPSYPIYSIFSLSDSYPIISQTSNNDIYLAILKNLGSDIFKEHKCN